VINVALRPITMQRSNCIDLTVYRASFANDPVNRFTAGAFSQVASALAGFPLGRSRVSIHL